MNTTLRQGAVVVGVDGSAASDSALEWAVEYAVARRRPLTIVNGAGDLSRASGVLGWTEARDALRTSAQEVSEHTRGVLGRLDAPELEVDVQTPMVDPREALIDLSSRASMVVVGTRGYGPIKALLMGSVSSAVAAHATCPVAVVRPTDRDTDGHTSPIVVGVDEGPSSAAALAMAFDLASSQDRPLDVVHTWSSNDTFIDRNSYLQRVEQTEAHERALSEALAGYAEKYPDVAVRRHLPDDGPVPALVEMSKDARLLVVGSRGRTGLASVIGSVSRDVLEHAHCTVLVVRP
jgi:nucleotide-binding universal stress UspA family protein